MNDLKDYYHILGVDKSAPPEEIKRVYRRLAIKYHPDHNPGDKKAEEQFKLISEAYAVLIDSEKRTQYDRAQNARPEAQFRNKTGSDFSYSQEDIFRDFFAGAYARQAFRDLAKEFKRSGFRFDDKFFDRVFFGGRGFFFGGIFFSGQKNEKIQRDAGPDYRTSFSQQARAASRPPKADPPKVTDGLLTRLGRGAVKVARNLLVAPEPALTATDINFNMKITPDQARKGAELSILYRRDGGPKQVSIKIPPGTREGARLRLKNMGEKRADGLFGDLYIHIHIRA